MFTKLPGPDVLPTAHVRDVSFSPDGEFMAVAFRNKPYLFIYSISSNDFTKLSTPQLGGQGEGVAFSPNGKFLVASPGVQGSSGVTVFLISGNEFVHLINLPETGTGNSMPIVFSQDGKFLAFGSSSNNGIIVYSISGNTFTRLPNIVPSHLYTVGDIAFSPDGKFMSVAHVVSSKLHTIVFSISGNTFTKLIEYIDTGRSAFSPDGKFILTHQSSPGISVYSISGTTFTKLPDIVSSLLNYKETRITFSPDGKFMDLKRGGTSPNLVRFSISGSIFTKILDYAFPTEPPHGSVTSSPDGRFIVFYYGSSPYLTIYSTNQPPLISGLDSNLGLLPSAFTQLYTVSNPDVDTEKTLTVTEKLNNITKRTFDADWDTEYTFDVNADEWIETLNGTHAIEIIAEDNMGGVSTRTYAFSKNETQIELTLISPLLSDDMVTRMVMNITRQIPAGAAFTAEVCNNAFDDEPTWEDITNAVIEEKKFFFSNEIKTAENWGFNFRIKVDRQSGVGDCYIQGIGGNFE